MWNLKLLNLNNKMHQQQQQQRQTQVVTFVKKTSSSCQKTIKFNGLENQISKVKFITDKLQLQDMKKYHPLEICFYKSCNKITKRPLMMSKHFGIQPKKNLFSNQ